MPHTSPVIIYNIHLFFHVNRRGPAMKKTILFAILLTLCVSSSFADSVNFTRHWTHISETSAAIYWQLSEIESEALSYVEYGVSSPDEHKTATSEKPRWSQFHRLTGLKAGASYKYRMVVVDPATGSESRSEVRSFTTGVAGDIIRIPGDLAGPPYVLDIPGAYYLLTEDVRADGTAFELAADDITLDLDGHTVLFGDDSSERVYGVNFAYGDSLRLLNGRIVQGRRSNTYSAAMVSLDRPQVTEIAGISTDVHLKGAYPLNFTHCTNVHIHHNDIYSRVTELECRHYPGNILLRLYIYDGGINIHDNILTEGCHWGIALRMKSDFSRDIEVHHNDIRHHQQYVNGYAISPCSGADVHHNRISSTGRGIHVTRDGILIHDNWIKTQGHMHLSDLPARTRPFHHRLIELHGIKLEGRRTKNCKIYNNTVQITQHLPKDSGGLGSALDKVANGVYEASTATSGDLGRIVDVSAEWELDRWRNYRVRYSEDHPPALITGNDATTIFADFKCNPGAAAFSIYMPWEYVPPTPLNIACYDPNAMNEVYGNTFTGITHYTKTRHGGYGDTGQWATSIMCIGMSRGASEAGKYPVWVHDNTFRSNDLFMNSGSEINMNIRIEDNTFILLDAPHTVQRENRLRSLGVQLEKRVRAGNNEFNE